MTTDGHYKDAENLFGGRLDLDYYDPQDVTKDEVIANIDRIIGGQKAEPYVAVVSMKPEYGDDD